MLYVLQENHPVDISQIHVGDTVAFEVAPNSNMVSLFTPLPAGMQGTVTQVSDNSVTVRYNENGQEVTRTFSRTSRTRFYDNGQFITAENWQGAFQPNETVWIYGTGENPQLLASNVTTGFESAMVTAPGTMTTTTTTTTTKTEEREHHTTTTPAPQASVSTTETEEVTTTPMVPARSAPIPSSTVTRETTTTRVVPAPRTEVRSFRQPVRKHHRRHVRSFRGK